MLSIVLMLGGLGIAAVGAMVYRSENGHFPFFGSDGEHAQPATRTASQASSPLDGTIKLECLSEIFRFPADGKLIELIIHSTGERPAAFQNAWISDYAYQQRPDIIPTRGGRIDKCRITNFGTAPVFNIKIEGEIDFSEHIRRDPIVTEQRHIAKRTFEILLPQVDPGPAGAADVLVWNTTKFHAAVAFANDVELQRLGSTVRENVKLIPAFAVLSLWPPETPAPVQQTPAIPAPSAPVPENPKPPATPAAPQRNPNGLYQLGDRVGTAVGANIMLGVGRVSFEELYGVNELNDQQVFEFQDYVLKFISADGKNSLRAAMTLIGISKSGGMQQNIVPNVLCEIVGKRN
jgi:hypothetical protein